MKVNLDLATVCEYLGFILGPTTTTFSGPNTSFTMQTSTANQRTSFNVQGNGAQNARFQTTYGNVATGFTQYEQLAASTQINFGANISAFYINTTKLDVDFIVRGDTDNDLLRTDASTNRVGVGTSTPQQLLDVDGTIGYGTGDSTLNGTSQDLVNLTTTPSYCINISSELFLYNFLVCS